MIIGSIPTLSSVRQSNLDIKSLKQFQRQLQREHATLGATTSPSPANRQNWIVALLAVPVVAAVAGGFAACLWAPSPAGEAADTCCTVPFAEVDDAATVAARAKAGTGPPSGFVADRQLQSDLAVIGKLENGLNIYSFRYLWDDTVWVGLVADDLLARDDTKSAVLTLSNGIRGIDYGALGLRIATLTEWQRSGHSALRSDYTVSPNKKRPTLVRLHNRYPAAGPGDAKPVETGSLR
jgi:hypothetical protein